MTDSLILVQLNESPDVAFEKPMLSSLKKKLPALVTFDFDGFSEESTRRYAIDLIKQSKRAAVVIEANVENGPYTGLVQFINQLHQLKHPRLLLIKKGALPAQMEKLLKISGGSRYKVVETTDEAESLIFSFLDNP